MKIVCFENREQAHATLLLLLLGLSLPHPLLSLLLHVFLSPVLVIIGPALASAICLFRLYPVLFCCTDILKLGEFPGIAFVELAVYAIHMLLNSVVVGLLYAKDLFSYDVDSIWMLVTFIAFEFLLEALLVCVLLPALVHQWRDWQNKKKALHELHAIGSRAHACAAVGAGTSVEAAAEAAMSAV